MKRFADLVNLGMVTGSLLPFLLGILYSYYQFHTVNVGFLVIFLICLLCLNFTVNVLDNCEDYLEAKSLDDKVALEMNVLYRYHLTVDDGKRLIRYLLIIAAVTGFVLVFRFGWPILIMGLISLAIGILYSQGPHPLSRYPIGEPASGLIMGFVVILAISFIDHPVWNWAFFWKTLVVSLPSVVWISNMLLANNICDDAVDRQMGRRTLVYFIGIKRSLHSFAFNNVVAFVAIVVSVICHWIPWTCLSVLILIPFVIKQSKILFAKQDKAETFSTSVNIMLVCSILFVISFFVGLFVPAFV